MSHLNVEEILGYMEDIGNYRSRSWPVFDSLKKARTLLKKITLTNKKTAQSIIKPFFEILTNVHAMDDLKYHIAITGMLIPEKKQLECMIKSIIFTSICECFYRHNDLMKHHSKIIRELKPYFERIKTQYIYNTRLETYYITLYGIPFSLRDTSLTPDQFYYFQNYLRDPICGHPKASHGWFQESLDDLRRMGITFN